jgi:hypothetical protein
MQRSSIPCPEVTGPVCLYLAERWRKTDDHFDICERHNLEMATMFILRWIEAGDLEKLRRAGVMLQVDRTRTKKPPAPERQGPMCRSSKATSPLRA